MFEASITRLSFGVQCAIEVFFCTQMPMFQIRESLGVFAFRKRLLGLVRGETIPFQLKVSCTHLSDL